MIATALAARLPIPFSPLDFSALIQNATEQGARLFVEVGADRQTSTLIDKISHAHAGQSTANAATAAIACNAKVRRDYQLTEV